VKKKVKTTTTTATMKRRKRSPKATTTRLSYLSFLFGALMPKGEKSLI